MKEEEKFELEMDYAFKVIHDDFPFYKIRPELEQLNLSEQEISLLIKEIDNTILLNTVENKLEKRRFTYQKSGIGILITLIFFLLHLAYDYRLIEVENVEIGTLLLVLFVVSFFFYRKVKMPKGKFINKNKFKNY